MGSDVVGTLIKLAGYGDYAKQTVFGEVIRLTPTTVQVVVDADPYPAPFHVVYNRVTSWPLDTEPMGRIHGFRPLNRELAALRRMEN